MSINVQQYWKTKIYISQDAHVWVVHRWVQHSHSRRYWHRKEVLHISNLLFCTVKFNVCNGGGPGNTSRHPQYGVWSGLNFLLWILHSKKPWWQNQEGGKELSFFAPHMGSRRPSFITRIRHRSSHCFCSEKRADVVSGLGWRNRGKGLVGGIYMKAVIVIHFAQKAGSSISWRTCVWSKKPKTIFLYPTQYTVHHRIQAWATVLLSCKKDHFLCSRYSM